MKTVLLVTWFYISQPPVSYQTVFNTEDACARARVAVLMEAERLKNEVLLRLPGVDTPRMGYIPSSVPPWPTVSAVFSPLG